MKQKFKLMMVVLITALSTITILVSCKKTGNGAIDYGNAPRTNPMPAELSFDWQMTTSGGGYVYDGIYFGNSGNGAEINMKSNGTGWWNTIYQVAVPGCVLVQNLSTDCTFEIHNSNGRNQIYVYITGGTFHEEKCTGPDTDQDLKKEGKTYPDYPPLIYDYKIVAEDNNPSLKLLLLSQEADESIRFNPHYDTEMLALKKLN